MVEDQRNFVEGRAGLDQDYIPKTEQLEAPGPRALRGQAKKMSRDDRTGREIELRREPDARNHGHGHCKSKSKSMCPELNTTMKI